MNIRILAGSFAASCLLTLLVLAACSKPLVERDEDRLEERAIEAEHTGRADPRLREVQVPESRVKNNEMADSMPFVQQAATGSPYAIGIAPDVQRWPAEPLSRENYAHLDENPVHLAGENPVSTFSVDVDTASYTNLRRWLNQGSLPPQDAVRVEEMLNYFDYGYAPPADRKQPFRYTTALSSAPWNPDALLLRIGIKGYEVARAERPAANLVFLVDVSGSMQSPDKLELLKQALGLLVNELDAQDRISLVAYAGASGVVLSPTPGDAKGTIRAAVTQLAAGGSTNGAAGIRLAYDMAEQAFIKDGINRVILATDGDFNVGTVNFEELVDMVERRRDSGITLTTLGFGTGNYNDHLMEQLADKGNGNYAYVDTLKEAHKVFVEETSGTLMVIAKDVKAQIEFNPDVVAEYRLIGYENRVLAREDFNNDQVDAGDIGAGHTVTALYEIVLNDSKVKRVDPLRYATESATENTTTTTMASNGEEAAVLERVTVTSNRPTELAFLKLRYKLPNETDSRLMSQPVFLEERVAFERADADFRFAAAVAAFGQKLRGRKYSGDLDYTKIGELARAARGEDRHGYRGEFLQLVALAESLEAVRQTTPAQDSR